MTLISKRGLKRIRKYLSAQFQISRNVSSALFTTVFSVKQECPLRVYFLIKQH